VEVYNGPQNALRVEPTGSGEVVFFQFTDGEEQAESLRFSGTEFRRVGGRD
jgi:hypothetical protein